MSDNEHNDKGGEKTPPQSSDITRNPFDDDTPTELAGDVAHPAIEDDDSTQVAATPTDNTQITLRHFDLIDEQRTLVGLGVGGDDDPTIPREHINAPTTAFDEDPTQNNPNQPTERYADGDFHNPDDEITQQPTSVEPAAVESDEDAQTHINVVSQAIRADDIGDTDTDITIPNAAADDATVRTSVNHDELSTELAEHSQPTFNTSRSNPQLRVLKEAQPKYHQELGPNTLLKGRFLLQNTLGEGGMGVVYKAIDLLKKEARDRNPHVAIKVLTESFKKQSGSFIALQREASKAQKLAHPNIATVYDFDRDGDTVFMTMELLEGMPLNQFIRKLKGKGLPEAEAHEIIMGLASGLAYSHQKGLVHSDFKPGNAFINPETGMIKVLDFGIARAAKHKVEEAPVEKTMFDPSTLGALTPAYATIEMFEGKEPDPRDDIYALACVSYELLTGKHPFNKLSAPKARAQELIPAPIPNLTRRQQQALRKALDFDRDKRTATIEEFIDGITRRRSRAGYYVAAGLLITALVGAASYPTMQGYYQARQLQTLLGHIKGDRVSQQSVLNVLNKLDSTAMQFIGSAARNEIVQLYEHVVEGAIDSANNQYNFTLAEQRLNEGLSLFPDSASLRDTQERIQGRKHELINSLSNEYDSLLASRLLVPIEGERDITDVLDILRQVDATSPLLTDQRLGIAYAAQAEMAIAQNNYPMADNLLAFGNTYAGEYERLRDLHDSIRLALEQRQLQDLLAEVQSQLSALTQSDNLADFETHRHTLERLAAFSIDNTFTQQLFSALDRAFRQRMASLLESANVTAAEQLLRKHAKMLPIDSLLQLRQLLTSVEQDRDIQPEVDTEATKTTLTSTSENISQLLSTNARERDWEKTLQTEFRSYLVLQRDSEQLTALMQKIVLRFNDMIEQAVEEKRFLEARRLLSWQTHLEGGESEKHRQRGEHIRHAEQRYQDYLQEQERIARIEGSKQALRTQARANNLLEARATYLALRKELGEDDPFITETAPQMLADAYSRLSQVASRNGDYTTALDLANLGLGFQPTSALLIEKRDELKQTIDEQKLTAAILDPQSDQLAALHARLIALREALGPKYSGFRRRLEQRLSQRITALEESELRQAHKALELAKALFPDSDALNAVNLKALPTPSQYASSGLERLQGHYLTAARDKLKRAQAKEPRHPDTVRLHRQLEAAIERANGHYISYRTALSSFNFDEAEGALRQAIASWRDNEDYLKQRTRLKALKKQKEAGATPCEERFSGYGTQKRATCFDIVGPDRQRGPKLVVIPAGGGHSSPFAISKYEISVSDFNLFCAESPHCSVNKSVDASLPVTNITAELAKHYTEWLTQRTGQSYRIPNQHEWKHAAGAGGNEQNSDYNCNFRIGGQQVKGLNLVSVSSGKSNRWGLVNYVGNAAELIRSGSSYRLLGGSYLDSMSNCSINLSVPLNQAKDIPAGLRVLRLLNY